jgi:hypothetical protein
MSLTVVALVTCSDAEMNCLARGSCVFLSLPRGSDHQLSDRE